MKVHPNTIEMSKETKKHAFSAGEVVTLKGGTIKMVIDGVYGMHSAPQYCVCMWHDSEGKPMQGQYYVRVLTHCTD